jgi:hypothetical protein
MTNCSYGKFSMALVQRSSAGAAVVDEKDMLPRQYRWRYNTGTARRIGPPPETIITIQKIGKKNPVLFHSGLLSSIVS